MDPYKVLGLQPGASLDEAKSAYRTLSKKYHPDITGTGNEAKFKEISEAYDRLKNPQAYAQPQFNPGFHNMNMQDIHDMFSELFGNDFRGSRRPQRQDILVEYEITLEQAYTGVEVPIQFTTPDGSKRDIRAKFNPGTTSNTRIRYKDQGYATNPNNIPGDLIIGARVAPHPVFKRDDNALVSMHLQASIQVTTVDLMIGKVVPFTTISGKEIRITIPAGTKVNEKFRLQREGMPYTNNPNVFGDCFIILDVVTPKLTESQKEKIKSALDL